MAGMKIGLVSVDGHNFPNLALMKLSAWHKQQGDIVEWASPILDDYDRVYMSKVFTFTPDCLDIYHCDVVRGGTGYKDYDTVLPDDVEHICPDYSLYGNTTTAYGFLTRGCVNKCPWCVVPNKEGYIRPNADIDEFIDGRKEAVLLDNNVLASDWGLEQIKKIVERKIRVDFNQGLDARIIAKNPDIARLLSKVKWSRYIRMAYDSSAVESYVMNAIYLLHQNGIPYSKMFFYVLIGKDTDDALRRIYQLRALGCKPFAQPYRDFSGKSQPTVEQKRIARWCNHKAIFNTVKYEDYKD